MNTYAIVPTASAHEGVADGPPINFTDAHILGEAVFLVVALGLIIYHFASKFWKK